MPEPPQPVTGAAPAAHPPAEAGTPLTLTEGLPARDGWARDRPTRVEPERDGPERDGPEGNARLTGLNAAVLLVLLAAEGVTLLAIHPLLSAHVFLGMLLVPPVALKIGSTGWRIVRYYLGSPDYRRRGPPPLVLRLLGPVVIVLTGVLLASGIALMFVPRSARSELLFVHKASFVLWFGAMTIHVLAHLLDTARLAPADLVTTTRRQVRGAGARLWALAAAMVLGLLLGIVMLPTVSTWLASGGVTAGG